MTFKSEHLYFIAIVPPDDISGQITAMKHYMAETYQSKHALRSPPHITLHMPFKWKLSKQEALERALTNLGTSIRPFDIEINGFGCFSPRVIFAAVEGSDKLSNCFEATKRAMRSLNVLNANYKDRPFHPHATIAFRDLKKAKFQEAWSEFSTRGFEASFKAQSIALLQHNAPEKGGPQWKVVAQYPLRD